MKLWNELKRIGIEQRKYKDRIDSLLGWIKEKYEKFCLFFF